MIRADLPYDATCTDRGGECDCGAFHICPRDADDIIAETSAKLREEVREIMRPAKPAR